MVKNDHIILEDKRFANFIYQKYENKIYYSVLKYVEKFEPKNHINAIYFRFIQFAEDEEFLNVREDSLRIKGCIGVDANNTTIDDYKEDGCSAVYYVFFKLNLLDLDNSFVITSVDNCFKNNFKFKLRNDLLPVLSTNQYDERAELFLKKYYPEYNKNSRVDVNVILERMNLKVVCHKLSQNGTIFGAIAFNDARLPIYDIGEEPLLHPLQKGTIVIDTMANWYLNNEGKSETFTVIHECMHWELHRKYFLAKEIIDSRISLITCDEDNSSKTIDKDDLRLIEGQANSIASCVIMPKDCINNKYNEFMLNNYNLMYEHTKLELMIDYLTDFYNISKTACKIRLKNLGYNITGIYEYIDNNYVDSYRYVKNIAPNQSYSISFDDYLLYSFINPKLNDLIINNNMLFVDNHLCVDSVKYINKDFDTPRLTPYARDHIDECCLLFTFELCGSSNNYNISDYILCKSKGNAKVRIKGVNDFIKIKSDCNLDYDSIIDTDKLSLEIKNKSFAESLSLVMEHYGFTTEKLAEDMHCSGRTIDRLREDDTYTSSFDTIAALTFAMHLPAIISQLLREKKYINVFRENQRDWLIYQLMLGNYYYTIDMVNEILEKKGMKLLKQEKE